MTLDNQRFPRFFAADKLPGWHSRRHRTRDAQDAARERYRLNRGRVARVRRATERALLATVETVPRNARSRRGGNNR